MNFFKTILDYINPIHHLGERTYSYKFSFFTTFIACIGIEIYVHNIAKDTTSLATLAIIVPIALIVYFSVRDGLKGGLSAVTVTIAYYLYIILSLHYTGVQLISGVITTSILAIIYAVLAIVIGLLKQTIDSLIRKERMARYRAEEGKVRLQTILDQLPVGVLIADRRKGSLTGNKQMEKITGKRSFVSKNAPILRALHHGEVIIEEEILYVRSDKRRVFLHVNAAPIKNSNGEIVAAVSTLHDVTQIKELDIKKDDFINMASHELKTPLTSMKLYLAMLFEKTQKGNNTGIEKIVHDMGKQTEKLQKLTNDLLDVSLVQTGKLSLHIIPSRLDTLIRNITAQLQTTTNQKILFTQKSPVTVPFDSLRIGQVLINIINNAIKYSHGKGDIAVALHIHEKSITVSVRDHGIGIPKNQEKRIFDKLYRVSENKGNTFPGLGMGLYIAQGIIKSHKGDMWAENAPNNGSIFYFTLPK